MRGRTMNYNRALNAYFLGEGNITQIAKKYKVSRSGLSIAISKAKKINCLGVGEIGIKEFADNTKATLMQGLNNLQVLNNVENGAFKKVANGILEDLKNTNIITAKTIQNIGIKLLSDFDREINNLREQGLLDLEKITASFEALATANKVLGMPQKPLIAIQNNIQNTHELKRKEPLNVNIDFVESKEKKIIDIEELN